MADLWRDLPLSGRPSDDESGVTSDWRSRTAGALTALADQLDALPDEHWGAPTLRPARGGAPMTVEQTARDLLRELVTTRLQALLAADVDVPDGPVGQELRAAAARFASGTARKGLGPLRSVVVHSYDITVPLGLPDRIDSRASGAVALALAAAAPARLRGVLAGRSLAADDAGWSFGTGPAIRGSAGELVSWLAGRDVRPRFDAQSR